MYGIFCGNYGIFVAIMVFLWQSWYFCGNHGIFVAIMVFLWQSWYFCGNHGIFVASMVFLWQNLLYTFPLWFVILRKIWQPIDPKNKSICNVNSSAIGSYSRYQAKLARHPKAPKSCTHKPIHLIFTIKT
jgi:hypothetical protein